MNPHYKFSYALGFVFMEHFSHNIMVIIISTGIILPLVLVLVVNRLKCPGLIMT